MADPKPGKVIRKAANLLNNISQDEAQRIDFDLDNWITDFEQGFPRFTKINPNFQNHYWGQGLSNRPRIKELNEQADAQAVEGYRLVEFFPDRENKEESYLLFGTPLEIMTQCSFFMNMKMMLGLNQGDYYLGYPVDEYLRLKPRTGLTIQLILTTYKEPPYYKRGVKWFSKRQVTIPWVDRSKLTYESLRNACGGDNGQDWGEWTARAYISMDDESAPISQMVAGGSTEDKAKKNLEAYLQFTKATVRGLSANKIDYSKGDRAKDPNKSRFTKFEVYPSWVGVLNTKLVNYTDRRIGKQTLSGKQLKKQLKFYLYQKKEPLGWTSDIRDVTKDIF